MLQLQKTKLLLILSQDDNSQIYNVKTIIPGAQHAIITISPFRYCFQAEKSTNQLKQHTRKT